MRAKLCDKSPESHRGSILPTGVYDIIKHLDITSSDVFVDLGCGAANVLIQIILSTNIHKCVGVEMRSDLLLQANTFINKHLLTSISLYNDKIENINTDLLTSATILYSFNLVFTPETNNRIIDLSITLPHLRLIILAMHPCPRHRARCKNSFCEQWSLVKQINVQADYTTNKILFYIFQRSISLNDINID